MMNYSYLVGFARGDEAVAIDVSWSATEIIEVAKKDGRKIVAVLLTHTHYDHCNAVGEFVKRNPVPVYLHEDEGEELPKGIEIIKTKDADIIERGGVKIKCLHTPGHSPGSQCYIIDDAIFTGDMLFVDNCGRTDLPGGAPDDLMRSLAKLAGLPENTRVFPGHNYGSKPTSTIGEQRRNNPYMREAIKNGH